jgi:hypothetical protein
MGKVKKLGHVCIYCFVNYTLPVCDRHGIGFYVIYIYRVSCNKLSGNQQTYQADDMYKVCLRPLHMFQQKKLSSSGNS